MKESKYKIIKIEKKYEKLRIDKFLYSIFTNVNNILIQKAIRNKDVLLNNKNIKNVNITLMENDELMLSNFIIKIFKKWIETNCTVSSDKKSCIWTVKNDFDKELD